MKSCKCIVIAAVINGAALVGLAADPNTCPVTPAEPIGLGFSTDYFSKYIWRGQVINPQSVIQPSIYLSKFGFTGTIWSNLDATGIHDNRWEFNEIDSSLDYTAAIPDFNVINVSAGVVNYDFPNTSSPNTTEVYGGFGLNACPLNPNFKVYRDVDEIKGTYYQFAIGQTFDKIKQWSEACYCGVQLGASTGYGNSPYNKGYFGVRGGSMQDLTLNAALPITISSWTVKPSINYSTMLADKVRSSGSSLVAGRGDNIWFGINISTQF
jgi:hypothetical protein